jgi:hypothetical protein
MTQAVALAQQASTGVSPGFRNRIINGAMVIDQRNAGASLNPADGAYSLDRWKCAVFPTTGKYTIQQDAGAVTPPVGFSDYLGITSSSAYTSGSTDQYFINQRIEGFNWADLGWGTANAKTVTLSFWARSSLTGTFAGSIINSAGNRSYPFTYTINAANTWEYETITITGETSGSWGTTNNIGALLVFNLGCGSATAGTAGAWVSAERYTVTGSTNLIATNGATLYITGVQLEVGSTATSFDYLDYGRSLIQCQRYCFAFGGLTSSGTSCVMGVARTTSVAQAPVQFPIQMRGYPSLTVATPSNFYTNNIGANTNSSAIVLNTSSSTTGELEATLVSAALTTGQAIRFFGNNSSLAIFSAEL